MFKTREVLARLRDSLKIILEHQCWEPIAQYEQEIIRGLQESAYSLNVSSPHYERSMAYLQGQIKGIRLLIEGRKAIKDNTYDSAK